MIDLPAILINNAIGVTLMLILLISSHIHRRSVSVDEKFFKVMIFFTMFQCVTEALSFVVDGRSFAGAAAAVRILNVLLFVVNISFAYLWTVYVDYKIFRSRLRLRQHYGYMAIPALLIVVMSLANLFTDVFFTVLPGALYQRLPLCVLPYIMSYAYLAYGVALVCFNRRNTRKYVFMPVMIFLIPVFLGSVCQFLFYGLSMVWVSVAVGMVSLYINIQNEDAYVDAMTGLYNRLYLNRRLLSLHSAPGHPLGGVMLDIDHFKQINDSFGHMVGDQALQDMGVALRQVAEAHGALAIRYGGDEFILLKEVRDRQELQQMIDALSDAVQHVNHRLNRPYQLAFSAGTALLRPQRDTPDSFLNQMDAAMYRSKRKQSQPERESS